MSPAQIFGLLVAVMLAGCSAKTGCDDPRVIDQVTELTRGTAARDLAYQCERVLYEKVPDLRARCEGEKAHSDDCMSACKQWATDVTSAKVDTVIQSFRDQTVALQSCKAKVHYSIDFDGGQSVEADVRYYVTPEFAGPKVELAK